MCAAGSRAALASLPRPSKPMAPVRRINLLILCALLLLGGCATTGSAPEAVDDGGARALAEGGD